MTILRRVSVLPGSRPDARTPGHWRAIALVAGAGTFAALLALSLLAVVLA